MALGTQGSAREAGHSPPTCRLWPPSRVQGAAPGVISEVQVTVQPPQQSLRSDRFHSERSNWTVKGSTERSPETPSPPWDMLLGFGARVAGLQTSLQFLASLGSARPTVIVLLIQMTPHLRRPILSAHPASTWGLQGGHAPENPPCRARRDGLFWQQERKTIFLRT